MIAAGNCLRGWVGIPYAVVCDGELERLSREEFNALLLCDGETNINTFETDKLMQTLRSLEEKGLVVFSDRPGKLLPEQFYYHFDNRYVRDIYWSVTGRCNFRCRHCYLDSPDAAMGELSHEDALNIIEQIAECGIYHLILSGGEPLVRSDLWELVDYATGKGIKIDQVYTNGWLLTDDVLDAFERRGIKPEFSISFDGIGWHDWMRGIAGAEKAALDALRRCRDRGFPTNVEMCIHRGNMNSIQESLQVLADIGVGSVKCSGVSPTELWRRNAAGNELTMTEYVDAVFRYIPKFFEDGMPVDVLFGAIIGLYKGSTEYRPVAEYADGSDSCRRRYICGAVRFSCYIAPDGRMLPCMPIAAVADQKLFPKVQDIGLQAALKDSFYIEFANRRVQDIIDECKTCRECPYILRCGGGCRASAVMSGERNLMGPDPYKCLMWKEGYLQKLHSICDEAINKYCRVT